MLIILNIYYIYNNFVGKKLGFYHTGVQIGNIEYTFVHTHGIVTCTPKSMESYTYISSIIIDDIDLPIDEIIHQLKDKYNTNYHYIQNNCNHFSDDLCHILANKRIPRYINRLANSFKRMYRKNNH